MKFDHDSYPSVLSPPLARQHSRTFALIHDSSCGICNDLVDHISLSGYLVDEDTLLESVRKKFNASSQDGLLSAQSYRSHQHVETGIASEGNMDNDEYLHLVRRMTRYRRERDDAWEEASRLRAELLVLEKETSQLRTRIWKEEPSSRMIGPESASSTESSGSSGPSTTSCASSSGGAYSDRGKGEGGSEQRSNDQGSLQDGWVEFDPELFAELFKVPKKKRQDDPHRRTAAPSEDVYVQDERAVKGVESDERGQKGAVNGNQSLSVQRLPSKTDNAPYGQATVKPQAKDATGQTVSASPESTKPFSAISGSTLTLGNAILGTTSKLTLSRPITITSPKSINSSLSKGQSHAPSSSVSHTSITIYVDASAWGIGFTCSKYWLSWPFKPNWKSEDRDNNWAEMVAVELGLRTLICAFKSSLILNVYSDNQGVLHSLRAGFSSNVQHRDTLKEIVALIKAYDVVLNPIWIPSVENPADGPSRGRFGRGEWVFPWAAAVPARLFRFVDAPIKPDEVDG